MSDIEWELEQLENATSYLFKAAIVFVENDQKYYHIMSQIQNMVYEMIRLDELLAES